MFVVTTIGGLLPAAAQPSGWSTYHNDRFGVSADVPPNWQAGRPPDNNDGLTFTAPGGRAILTVYGSLNQEPDVTTALEGLAGEREDEQITYKRRIGNTMTLSGFKTEGRIFYAKYLLSCHNQILNSIYLEYPEADKAAYAAIVAHVAASLRAGPSMQVPNCGP